MSFAQTTSSSLGMAARSTLRPARNGARACLASSSKAESSSQARNYAASAETQTYGSSSAGSDGLPPSRTSSGPSETRSSSSSTSRVTPSVLTPGRAVSYLSDLFHLSPEHAFPEPLAMQTLTHKSYKYSHLVKPAEQSFRGRVQTAIRRGGTAQAEADALAAEQKANADFLEASLQPHNARLSFIGRRALTTYLALFVHDTVRTSRALRETAFLQSREGPAVGLDEKLAALRNTRNLGSVIGEAWGVGDVMRWDRNQNSLASSASKIKGVTVEAIFGALYSLHGGPAAQRAFHLHVLPHLATQLREPVLKDRARTLQQDVRGQFGGSVVLP